MAGRFFVYPFFWPASATGASPAWEALRPKAEMGSYEVLCLFTRRNAPREVHRPARQVARWAILQFYIRV